MPQHYFNKALALLKSGVPQLSTSLAYSGWTASVRHYGEVEGLARLSMVSTA